MLVLLSTSLAALSLGSCGAGESPTEAATEGYRVYLTENAARLLRDTQAMLPELEHGEVERAQSRYARARVRYSQVEPAAEMFPRLNRRIDGHEGEVAADDFQGFHRIEQALWAKATTRGMATTARRLIGDICRLQDRIEGGPLAPAAIAAGAVRLLDEVAAFKLAGKEEPHSEVDLVNVSGNLEAVGAAFAALRPLLSPQRRRAIERRLSRAYEEIAGHGTPARDPDQPRGRSPGAIFVVFSELEPASVAELRRRVEALGRVFAPVASELNHDGRRG